jgi:hypothetical protein
LPPHHLSRRLPESDARILHNLLPLLAAWMCDFERDGSPAPANMAGEEVPGGWGVPQPAVDAAMDVAKRNEVARKLAQVRAAVLLCVCTRVCVWSTRAGCFEAQAPVCIG